MNLIISCTLSVLLFTNKLWMILVESTNEELQAIRTHQASTFRSVMIFLKKFAEIIRNCWYRLIQNSIFIFYCIINGCFVYFLHHIYRYINEKTPNLALVQCEFEKDYLWKYCITKFILKWPIKNQRWLLSRIVRVLNVNE